MDIQLSPLPPVSTCAVGVPAYTSPRARRRPPAREAERAEEHRRSASLQLLAKNFQPVVAETISVFFKSGEPVVIEAAVQDEQPGDDDDETVTQIKELLDTRVRPSVAMDGGDIVYRGFERGVVYLSLQGACIGCPSSNATLKMGVENLLKHYVPDVLRVEAVE